MLRRQKRTLDTLLLQKVVGESRITVRNVRNRKLVLKPEQDFSMRHGESEAMAPALQERT